MSLDLTNYEQLTKNAVAHFWSAGNTALDQQIARGVQDVGNRSRTTAGKGMDGFIVMIKEIILANGLPEEDLHITKGASITLPGYYRATKMWDLVIVHHEPNNTRLVAAIELKSIASSFGNNLNNRCEEAIGSAADFDAAFRYNKFGTLKPFIGYLILMKDCPEVHKPVAVAERHFEVFEEFKEASYARRGELLCKRLVGEKLYDAATMLLSPEEEGKRGKYSELNEASGLKEWVALLAGHVAAVAATIKPSSHPK